MQRADRFNQPRTARPTAAHCRRGAVLYSSVLATSLLVALLSLTAIQVLDVGRRGSQSMMDSSAARTNARVAVELALQDLWADADWRTRYTHNVETSQLSVGAGTVSWRLKDTTDSSLSDDANDPVEVIGVGRVGTAAWVHSVTVQPVEREIGPIDLRAYIDTTNVSTDVVTPTRCWAQYFRPYLPNGASSWRITGMDFYARQDGPVSGSTAVSLYLPQSNLKPGSTLIDSASIAETALSSSLSWRHVDFTSTTGLDPGVGICLTFTTTSGTPMRLAYDANGVDAQNTRLIDGNPAWQNTYPNASILFRATGYYRMRELQVVSGSWRRAALP